MNAEDGRDQVPVRLRPESAVESRAHFPVALEVRCSYAAPRVVVDTDMAARVVRAATGFLHEPRRDDAQSYRVGGRDVRGVGAV